MPLRIPDDPRMKVPERIVYYCSAALMGLVPVIFYPGLIDAFNLPKAVAIRLLLALGAFAVGAAAITRRSLSIDRGILWLPGISYLAVTAASCVFSINPFHSLWGQHMFHIDGMIDTVGFFAFFALCAGFLPYRGLQMMPRMIVAGSIPVILYGFAQAASNDPVGWQSSSASRIWSTFGNPNFLAGYLVLTVPIAIGYWYTEKSVNRLIAGAAACGGLACLMLTSSRAGIVGIIAAAAVFSLLALRGRGRILVLGIIGIVTAGILSAAVIMRGQGSGDIEPIAKSGAPLQRLSEGIDPADQSITARRRYAATAWHMVRQRPLLGYGPDTYTLLWRRSMRAEDAAATGNRLANPGYAHSEFLNILATMGVLGGMAYLAFWGGLLLAGRGAVRATMPHDEGYAVVLAAVTAGCAGLLAANQFSFHSPATALAVWGCAAILVRGRQLDRAGNINFGSVSSLLIALTLFAGAVLLAVQASAAWRAEAHFPKGLQYEAKGLLGPAIDEYRMAVTINPMEQTYYQNLAKAYLTRAEKENSGTESVSDISKAVDIYRRHLTLVPQDALSWNGLGIALLQAGKPADAQAAFLRALEEAPSFLEPHINLGTIAFDSGRAAEAFAWYEKALRIEPREPLIFFNMGNMHAQQGDMERALKCWYDALDVDPSYSPAQENINRYLAQRTKK